MFDNYKLKWLKKKEKVTLLQVYNEKKNKKKQLAKLSITTVVIITRRYSLSIIIEWIIEFIKIVAQELLN